MTPSNTALFPQEGRTALCKGATRGIGAQMAIALAEAGADVLLVQRLTRDQRRDILLLRKTGKPYFEIATFLGVTERAVQYTCETQQATPKKEGRGRRSKLSEEQVDELVALVRQSKDGRRITYEELGEVFTVHQSCIKRALRRRGYHRRVGFDSTDG